MNKLKSNPTTLQTKNDKLEEEVKEAKDQAEEKAKKLADQSQHIIDELKRQIEDLTQW